MPAAWLRRRSLVVSLDRHPNVAEIVAILSRVPRLTTPEVAMLAYAWRDTSVVASARDRALAPDAPLVIEVLDAFDRVDAVFDDELTGRALGGFMGETIEPFTADGAATVLKPAIVNVALKAVRDAIAAAYARPILRRGEYEQLMSAWRRVFPAGA